MKIKSNESRRPPPAESKEDDLFKNFDFQDTKEKENKIKGLHSYKELMKRINTLEQAESP